MPNVSCRISIAASLLTLSALILSPTVAQAQTGLLDQRSAQFASHGGNIAFLAVGVLLPLARDHGQGPTRFWRTADALGTATLFSEGLKRLVREPRPDNPEEKTSFPSGHATAAFAVAAMESAWHRREAPLWFAGAFLIADSRVKLHRHRPKDVIAGALLGFGTATWERSEPRGLVLSPFVKRESDGRWKVGASGVF